MSKANTASTNASSALSKANTNASNITKLNTSVSQLQLTDDEIMAIRWHMNAWDLPFQSYDIKSNFNKAKEICPLLSLVQAADCLASNLLERKVE